MDGVGSIDNSKVSVVIGRRHAKPSKVGKIHSGAVAHQNIAVPNNNVKHMGDQDESPDRDSLKGESVTMTTHHSTHGPCKQH